MDSLKSLIARNLKIFYRTKGNFFFATLSVFILIILHFVIFQSMFTDSWTEIFKAFGKDVDKNRVVWFVDSLMFSAIIPIGAVTVSLVGLGLMVADREDDVLSDFMVAPFKRSYLLASYLISSFIAGLTILLGFIAFFYIYFMIQYGFGFSLESLGYILLTTMLSLVFANVFMLLIISFIKSQQSLGSLGTILGTGLGFLSGAYIPVGQFGDTVANVFSMLPFLQLTVISRQAFLSDLKDRIGLSLESISGEATQTFGIELWIFDSQMSLEYLLLSVGAVTFVLLALLVIRFKRMSKA